MPSAQTSQHPEHSLYIGTMSGTSADGLDIVIANIKDVNTIELVHSYFAEYPATLSNEIKHLQTLDSHTLLNSEKRTLEKLDQALVDFYAQHIQNCLIQTDTHQNSICAIGNHGQTILHQPDASTPFSLQICEPQQLSQLCQIPVIADFRSADIQQKGQGAPLMPAFHAAIFSSHAPCAVVNIGGISNTTLLKGNHVLGFDNGPGNTLMDSWIHQHRQQSYDRDGDWAQSGNLNSELLNKLLTAPYFLKTPPKSTGQDLFNSTWLNTQLAGFEHLSPTDIQTTLCELTAQSIINDIQKHKDITKIFICGGGANNSFLMKRLQKVAGDNITVNSFSTLGVDPNWVEALGFAWLAFCYKHNITGNLPSVTGAEKAVILGQEFKPKPDYTSLFDA